MLYVGFEKIFIVKVKKNITWYSFLAMFFYALINPEKDVF